MKYFGILAIAIFCGFNTFGQKENGNPEQHIRAIVAELDEVRAMENVYDSISNRVQTVKMVVVEPSGATPFYKVEVGYQGSNRFEPHYYFYIDPKDESILIEDMQHGDRTTLEEWRERKSRGASMTEPDRPNDFRDGNHDSGLSPHSKPRPVEVFE